MGVRRSLAAVATGAALLTAACTASPPGTTAPPDPDPSAGTTSPAPATPTAGASTLPTTHTHPADVLPRCHHPAGPTDPPRALGAVQFVGTSAGWLVGGDGVLATADGGEHWTRQAAARLDAADASLDMLDAHHGWVSDGHTMLRTVDGSHWSPLPQRCPGIVDLHFVDARHGFGVTGGGAHDAHRVVTTSDGGDTWRVAQAPGPASSICLTGSNGYLGARGNIYRTVDRGLHWALIVRAPRHWGEFAVASVECAGPDAGWAVVTGGAGMSQQAHLGYHLAGSTGTPLYAEQFYPHPGVQVTRESPGSYAGAFSAIDAGSAVFVDWCPACGIGTAPWALADDGGRRLQRHRTVTPVTRPSGAAFVRVAEGWVTGEQQRWRHQHALRTLYRVMHTTDGGRHWQTQLLR
jgi:hypothetical protein